jgi:hypothetical protein
MTERSASECEINVIKLQRLIRFPQNLFKHGAEIFAMRSVNLLILFGISRNFLKSGRSQSLYLFIRRVIKQIVVIIGAYRFCQILTKFYPTSFCQG